MQRRLLHDLCVWFCFVRLVRNSSRNDSARTPSVYSDATGALLAYGGGPRPENCLQKQVTQKYHLIEISLYFLKIDDWICVI